jgi:hexulose-6-phosphate isomerase
MDRRGFLKVAGAAAGMAAAAPIFSAGAEDTLKGKIKTAVGYDMIRIDGSPMDKLNLIKSLGIAGVELSIKAKVDHDELRKAADATGIPVHGIVHGWSLDNIPESIDIAKKLGATTVLVAPPQVKEDFAYDECYNKSQAVYREVLPYAEKQQVCLLLETVWNNFLLSPMEMARYIDEMNSPWFQGYFDIGNMVKYGWSEQWLRILGKRTMKIHLKDYSRKIAETQGPWKGFECEIGEGSNDWAAVRKALLDTGFQGWATAEVGGGDKARMVQLAEEMDKVMGLA